MTSIIIESNHIMNEGYYKVVFNSDDLWDKQENEWKAFKHQVEAQLKAIREAKHNGNT